MFYRCQSAFSATSRDVFRVLLPSSHVYTTTYMRFAISYAHKRRSARALEKNKQTKNATSSAPVYIHTYMRTHSLCRVLDLIDHMTVLSCLPFSLTLPLCVCVLSCLPFPVLYPQVKSLSDAGLGRLTALTKLSVSHNALVELPDLSACRYMKPTLPAPLNSTESRATLARSPLIAVGGTSGLLGRGRFETVQA